MHISLVSRVFLFFFEIKSTKKNADIEKIALTQSKFISGFVELPCVKDGCNKLVKMRSSLASVLKKQSGKNFYDQIYLNYIDLIDIFFSKNSGYKILSRNPLVTTFPEHVELPEKLYELSLYKSCELWNNNLLFLKFVPFYLCSYYVMDLVKRALESKEKNSIQLLMKTITLDYFQHECKLRSLEYVYNQIWNVSIGLAVDKSIRCNFILGNVDDDPLYEELRDLIFLRKGESKEILGPESWFFPFEDIFISSNNVLILKSKASDLQPKIIVISGVKKPEASYLTQPSGIRLIYNGKNYIKRSILEDTGYEGPMDNTVLMKYNNTKWEMVHQPEILGFRNERSELFFAVMFELLE